MQYVGLVAKGTAQEIPFALPATGLAVTISVRKNGGAFVASAGAVAEVANKLYRYTPTAGETDTEGKLTLYADGGGANVDLIMVDVCTFGDPPSAEDIDALLTQNHPGDWAAAAGDNVLGPGSDQCTLHYEDEDGNPLAGVQVWITTDAQGTNVIAGALASNDAGDRLFMLDDGVNYYRWSKLDEHDQEQGVLFTAVRD